MPDLGYAFRLLASPYALLLMVVTAAAVAVGAKPLARRFTSRATVAAVAIASAGLVLTITAPVTHVRAIPRIGEVWSWSRSLAWAGDGWTEVLLLPTGIEGWANLLLFVPAAVAWTMLTHRPTRVVAALSVLSVVAETLQAGVGIRVAEPRDVVSNVAGALLGVGIAALAVRLRDEGGVPTLRWMLAPRTMTIAVAVTIVAVTGVSAATSSIREVAADEQADLVDEVEAAYRGTTSADLESLDGGAEYAAFASRPGRTADYLGRAGDGVYEARFTLAGHARPRCVVVRWTDEGVRTTPEIGSPCTVFKDLGL